ncbi:MAG: hypothetical protein AMXMBFR82_26580 [Candidatus Hydrogenedentota bacterium]
MAEWTPEAQDYLDGYLRQVSALGRGQGDDATDIVDDLREHITTEVEAESGSLVTLDALRKTMAAVGTPEQVLSPEFSLFKLSSGTQQPRAAVQDAPQPRRGRSSCAIVAMILLAFAVIVAIFVPIMILLLRFSSYSAYEIVPATEVDMETGYPVAVLDRMKAIAAAQQDLRQRGALDSDGDGTPDYGTMRDIIDEISLPFELDARGNVLVEDYVFRVVTTPSGEPGGPRFVCTVRPPAEEMGIRQWAQIDQTGELRMIDPPLAAEESEAGNG